MTACPKTKKIIIQNKQYFLLTCVFIFSLVLFKIAGIFQHNFMNIMSVATYLAWHNIFEFLSVLVSFTVFSVSFFSYKQSGRIRSLFLGNIFLLTGIIDAFHTLSFKDMPHFFIANTGSNRATTFWIIARLIGALGFAISGFIPIKYKYKINKLFFIIPTIFLSLAIFIIATYYPSWLPKMFDEVNGLTGIKITLEYFIIATLITAIIKYLVEYRKSKDYMMVLLTCAMLLGIFSELAFVSYRNDVHHIYNYLGHVYKIISFFIIFRVIFIYNVQEPYRQLSEAQEELKDYIENLDKLVDTRTYELKKMNQKFLEDLQYARDIQKAILPDYLPAEKGISFCAKYFPVENVGGDFYNVLKLDEENFGIYIGDVSGHGVPAAMLTVFVNQSIKTIREISDKQKEILKPSVVLGNLYESFNKTNFKEDIYVVLLYGIYNIKARSLIYSSAGMNVEPVVIKAAGTSFKLPIEGFPICKFIEFYNEEYTDTEIKLDMGDKILFYTDGLTDAEKSEGQVFGEERLFEIIQNNYKSGCTDFTDYIEKCLFSFVDCNEIKDDITFLTMEIS